MVSVRRWSESDAAYEGAEEIEGILRSAVRPDPVITVSEWADRYRILSTRLAAEAGPYRTSRTSYLKEIMDALSPGHPARRVVFMKAAQVGATEAGNNWLGYIIHWAPAPVMAVWPTVDTAKKVSQQRIGPLIEDSPELAKLVAPAKQKDSGNTVLAKSFPGGILVMTGANSAVGLRSMPARYLFLDEVDAYSGDVDGEGDPISLAANRTTSFGRSAKTFLISTPLIHGSSRIEREYEMTDQRRFHVPCPHAKLHGSRKAGEPVWVHRGDGVVLGWYVVEGIGEQHEHLQADGVGAVVRHEIKLTKVAETGSAHGNRRIDPNYSMLNTLITLFGA